MAPLKSARLQRLIEIETIHRLTHLAKVADGFSNRDVRRRNGIQPLGVKRQRRFQTNVALPLGVVIVDVADTLAVLEAELTQHDVACIGAVATIILAENAEVVKVFVAPIKEDLEHEVELGQRGVAPHQESAPDEGADASQDDTQLIDVGMRLVWFHEQSV